jgi:transposase
MLVEAAQHLDKHPGPLGCFFRRLAKKKNRNVAVVAAARKLVAIAWQMLTRNEPYRYAIPRSTETKLSRLRVKATAQRRKSGAPKGTKCTAKLPGGSRVIRSLSGVCQSEGLPAPKPLSGGEKRTVARCGCGAFVDQLAKAHVVPRRNRKTSASKDEGAPRSPAACRASMRGFRRLHGGDQGDEAPPPGPPTLISIPERKRAARKSAPAS